MPDTTTPMPPTDLGGALRAMFINCTLSRSPAWGAAVERWMEGERFGTPSLRELVN